jgi:ABC-2 type transport system permease protein
MAGLLIVPIMMGTVSEEKQETVGVVDLSQEIFLDLDEKLGEEDYRISGNIRHYILKKFENPEKIRDFSV